MMIEISTEAFTSQVPARIFTEHVNIPAATASVGGMIVRGNASHVPFKSLVIAGITGMALSMAPVRSAGRSEGIEILLRETVPPSTQAQRKEIYQSLRDHIEDDGIPFLNESELVQEISDRKGIHF